jgi:mono/diheme cytochrome c family protein/uncharacterized membrane protein
MLLSVSDFIGRFHPVFVHLPIGILLLACLFQWLMIKERFAVLQPAIPVTLFWGMISAIVSCISGYLLSTTGDYDGQLVSQHQWLGISVAVVSLILYVLHKRSVSGRTARIISLVLFLLITITGHLGGSLTHGSTYLTEGLNAGAADKKGAAIPPIPNIQEAVVYNDMVKPLLEARCYSCHGPNKKKGKLRLDTEEFILKGGEDGKTIIAGDAEASGLIERLLLPQSDDDHMPPKEKPQLTQQEITLLHWWVSNGAHFSKKVKDLQQTEKIKPVLLSLQKGDAAQEETKLSDVPEGEVSKADDAVIKKLQAAGVIVIPVAQNSNYLSVNFVTAVSTADSVMKLLGSLKKQLLWLKLNNATVNDHTVEFIKECKAITRLQLNNTAITDKVMATIKLLPQLQSLNLVGTKVTAEAVLQLQSLKMLKHIYLYKTAVTRNNWATLQKAFPSTKIDSGNYVVPFLTTDTIIVTAPVKKQ